MLATAGLTQDELDRHLSTDPKNVDDGLAWWNECHVMYPHLSHMALNYLSIPSMLLCLYDSPYSYSHLATSVGVGRVFSCGHILLSHI